MENDNTVFTKLKNVPCGKKNVEVVKIENRTKKVQALVVVNNTNDLENVTSNLRVHPVRACVPPKQTARFTLSYTPFVEDMLENFSYNVMNAEDCSLVARLNVQAESVGPRISPQIFNLNFFRFRDINKTIRNIEIENNSECDTKFYFDLDENVNEFEISPRNGDLFAGHKLGLKVSFKPEEKPEVYYKKIFCIVRFHEPIIFNFLGIYQPKLKLDPKNICFLFPPQLYCLTGYEGYTVRGQIEKLSEGEKIMRFVKRFEDAKAAHETEKILETIQEKQPPPEDQSDQKSEKKYWNDFEATNVFLTVTYLNVDNSSEVPNATALINTSEEELYFFSWSNDPNGIFRIQPCDGFLQPKTRVDFTVFSIPPIIDSLFHAELDIKILPCFEPKTSSVYLPLTITLRIIGHSFSNRCHWLAQCSITPETLHLPPCVCDQDVFGTFMIEHVGHLPFTYEVVPPPESNIIVEPRLGYLSKSFQLFVVQFSSKLKESGIYAEDLDIIFNGSKGNVQKIKVVCSVERPTLSFGECNSYTFSPVFPGSTLSAKVPIINPTNLPLHYEFRVPEDITWTDVITPIGVIGPKSRSEVEVIFKPETPCEYLDYIPCHVSAMSQTDCTEIVHLQLIGSCQYGYLVAMPSYHSFGEIPYKESKTLKVSLFNFSSVMLCFALKPYGGFGAERDVTIIPDNGCVPPKGSFEIEVHVTAQEIASCEYEIRCQNCENDSNNAEPCDQARQILSIQYIGVLTTFQIIDIGVEKGGPLFSPDCLWKMFRVNEINAALNCVDFKDEIEIVLPEGLKDFGPVDVYLLMEATGPKEISCDSKLIILCPCRVYSKSSGNSSFTSSRCLHKKLALLKQIEQNSGPKKQLMLMMKLNYGHHCPLKMEIILTLSDERTVRIEGTLITLHETEDGTLSLYTKSTFHLKPVFVGDPHPPVQLFWLYNNTHVGACYCLDVVALRKSTIVQGVFDCINPTGIVPAYSSLPLGFVFRPNEIKSYSVYAFLHLAEDQIKIIKILGEGTLEISPINQFITMKTIPKMMRLDSEIAPLECYESTIDFNFIYVFSQAKRHFYIKNRSNTTKWVFSWHSYNVNDLFTATVEPEEGLIEPSQDVFMTLTLKSYCHQTSVNFSLPCDITNYSELIDYEKSVRARDRKMEKEQDHFSFNDKGNSQEIPNYPLSKKPEPIHIFITVNANIVTTLNIDQTLNQTQQSIMKAQNEMQNNMEVDLNLKPGVLPLVQTSLEKIIWHILCSQSVANIMENVQKSHDYNYSHLLPESKTKTKEHMRRLMALPEKSFIQEFLVNEMMDMICKKLNSVLENE